MKSLKERIRKLGIDESYCPEGMNEDDFGCIISKIKNGVRISGGETVIMNLICDMEQILGNTLYEEGEIVNKQARLLSKAISIRSKDRFTSRLEKTVRDLSMALYRIKDETEYVFEQEIIAKQMEWISGITAVESSMPVGDEMTHRMESVRLVTVNGKCWLCASDTGKILIDGELYTYDRTKMSGEVEKVL